MTKKHITYFILIQLVIIASIAAVFGVFKLIEVGLSRTEKYECYKLANYAERIEEFYLTAAEDTMCRHHGITIDAPVK